MKKQLLGLGTYSLKVVLAIIVLLVIIGVSNLPYFEEMRAFSKIEKTKDSIEKMQLIKDYEEEYPEGRYLDDVLWMKIELSGNDMNHMVYYIEKFPEGEHVEEVNNLIDTRWDNEIKKYSNYDKSKEDPVAVKYMTEMLQYMKHNRINTIKVKVNPTIELKDYTEYDENVRLFIETFSHNDALPVKGNVISIKENFSEGDNNSLMQILIDGVQKSMNRIFSYGFVKVEKDDGIHYIDQPKKNNQPVLRFDYTIKSQEDKVGKYVLPHLWTYVDNNNIPIKHLLGISITFKAHFTLPNSDISFDYTENSAPKDAIKNIDNVSDGYRQMTMVCFGLFSNKMARNMGLAEVYFQGEDSNDK